jgi:hypothetical protein
MNTAPLLEVITSAQVIPSALVAVVAVCKTGAHDGSLGLIPARGSTVTVRQPGQVERGCAYTKAYKAAGQNMCPLTDLLTGPGGTGETT